MRINIDDVTVCSSTVTWQVCFLLLNIWKGLHTQKGVWGLLELDPLRKPPSCSLFDTLFSTARCWLPFLLLDLASTVEIYFSSPEESLLRSVSQFSVSFLQRIASMMTLGDIAYSIRSTSVLLLGPIRCSQRRCDTHHELLVTSRCQCLSDLPHVRP